jgi:uncharacterized peroxidase-related enzyme
VTHHRRGLRRLLADDELLRRIEEDWRTAGLDARRHAMLCYVEKLTLTPARVERRDVDELRAQGFSDEDVLAIVEVTAYYAFANRIADGLGVEVEPWVEDAAARSAPSGGAERRPS